jgi:tRNA (adenine-N(1)-)-methyltransferase non-catalytic subunit
VLEKQPGELYSRLRPVPASELNADIVAEEASPTASRGEPVDPSATNGGTDSYDIIADDGTVIMKNNRLTIDDASRQALTHTEIEELKKSSGGKEIIEQILANHAGLSEKTAFAKAKYTLRKTKKYMKRFTVLPMELGYLIDYIMEKEPSRTMEIREETLGLVMAWSNAHFSKSVEGGDGMGVTAPGGRWLVIDDTAGLVTGAVAEKMNLLRKDENAPTPTAVTQQLASNGASESADVQMENGQPETKSVTPVVHTDFPVPATSNTITVLHAAIQPNISLLKYFDYDGNNPNPDHPLHNHLKTLSWLQLLHPEEDPTYREPEYADFETTQTWKSGKRGTYFKKRRRWERCKSIVDETRAGGFDGLVVASHMDPSTIFPHVVPLIRGGGHVVVYSPTVEPLVRLADLYSKDRRSAYLTFLSQHPGEEPDKEDFPVDPRLLLGPSIQTSRVRAYQVLPGRTHPLMTSKGGSEGYVFTARRVIPIEGGVEARGNHVKKRKAESGTEGDETST